MSMITSAVRAADATLAAADAFSSLICGGKEAASGRFLLHGRRVATGARKAVELGATEKRFLAGRELFLLAAPRFQSLFLQRTAIREGELPGERSELVHQAQVLGGFGRALPA